ncbi:4Fe-4S dicluster domain-containing protein [Pararhodobacter sp. SW119]|uniref:4Fe-4S binding protein n=1 Tax=Pararhodobacter sp. SW119 TaxID=2780075 RepID=UPI001FD7A8A3|nr:4Fe-4S dicluster domain-containing protein [Pararhodobacter sp. SW119]
MQESARTILTCSCEGTMPLDADALGHAGAAGRPAHQLCRAQLSSFRAALGAFDAVTVTCTQEAPLFAEVAEAEGFDGALDFVNIREAAGWSEAAAKAGPKMAALIAMAGVAPAPFETVSLESEGVTLVLGRDAVAVEAAQLLAEVLDLTVLLLPGAEVTPPRRAIFPVLQGRVRAAQGHLGAFELTVDDYAAPAPSSRSRLEFEATRDGAVSRCDLVIDLTGAPPLFSADALRPGYLRADPRDPVAVARLIARAQGMVGTFDKPKYIDFRADLCAHSRNRITGCTRCLGLCPTGAIEPAGDSVAIDPLICAGCGQCAAACPTGAASYALPRVEALALKLRAGLRAWYAAGGQGAPVLLLHDDDHGAALIDAAARFGRGLPAHAIPVQINDAGQVGPEVFAAALAWGAGAVRVLTKARPAHPLDGLEETLALMEVISAETGYPAEVCGLIQTDDPDVLEAALWRDPVPARVGRSSFLPPADKRGLLTLAMAEMNRAAPDPTRQIDLPAGAPFGAVVLDRDACTLCLACVGVCPTGALGDNPDRPMLRFTEAACVQCGLCAATCPEDAITLAPQIDFAAWEAPKRVLKEEEPFACTGCGKPFGTRSSIERVMARLDGHWMYSGLDGEKRRELMTLCDDCRTERVVIAGFDPHEKTH